MRGISQPAMSVPSISSLILSVIGFYQEKRDMGPRASEHNSATMLHAHTLPAHNNQHLSPGSDRPAENAVDYFLERVAANVSLLLLSGWFGCFIASIYLKTKQKKIRKQLLRGIACKRENPCKGFLIRTSENCYMVQNWYMKYICNYAILLIIRRDI